MLRGIYVNPEKELVRLHARGLVVRIAHGTYVAKPDTVGLHTAWKPTLEEAAMAYATAAYGDRVPVLAGIGAARHWGAIPRAIGASVIAVPEQHRPVTLATGGRIVFTVRDAAKIRAVLVEGGLGVMRVATVEQTMVDLALRPDLGGMSAEARAAAVALLPRVDPERLQTVTTALPKAAAARMRIWLRERGGVGGV
ncbi:MAG: type IV toxin-antitoxin system AbiEi family antitoxin [Bifidobacteriaceae bacterium]|jgi:predicted transcriptional regulator of viral defense system|nr:type IV toxin-antitoxin system AbiEi family antitoxin [Bifidobacteriaceae bacterium]